MIVCSSSHEEIVYEATVEKVLSIIERKLDNELK